MCDNLVLRCKHQVVRIEQIYISHCRNTLDDPILKQGDWITVSGSEYRASVAELESPALLTAAVKNKLDSLFGQLDMIKRRIVCEIRGEQSQQAAGKQSIEVISYCLLVVPGYRPHRNSSCHPF